MAQIFIFWIFIWILNKVPFTVQATYTCLCSYNIEKEVYAQARESTQAIGYLYQFDCKFLISTIDDGKWAVIAFEHQAGYVLTTVQMQVQTCEGNPPPSDMLFSTTSNVALPTASSSSSDKEVTTKGGTPATIQYSASSLSNKNITTNCTDNQSYTSASVSRTWTIISTKSEKISSTPAQSLVSRSVKQSEITTQRPVTLFIHSDTDIVKNISFTAGTKTTTKSFSKTSAFEQNVDNVTLHSDINSSKTSSNALYRSSLLTTIVPNTRLTSSVQENSTRITSSQTVSDRNVTNSQNEITKPSLPSTPRLENTIVDHVEKSTINSSLTRPGQTTVLTVSPVIVGRVDLCPYGFLAESHGNHFHNGEYPFFRQYDTYCYELRAGNQYNWKDASADCKARTGELAVANTENIQRQLQELVQKETNGVNAWIGLSKSNTVDTWKWINGKEIDGYSNWASSVSADSGLCSSLSSLSGLWETKSCSEKLYWICQYSIF